MNHNSTSNGGHTSHILLMLLCCLIPLALIAAIAIFGFSLGALTPYLPFAIVLLCPLMMFFMMRGMGHEHDATDAHQADTTLPQALTNERNSNTPRSAPTNAAMESKSHH